MEYANHLSEYAPAPSEAQVAEEVARIRAAAKGYETDEVYRLCYSAIDLTTLSCSDSVESVTAFARKAVEFYTNYPAIANVASICIYPPFVETVGLAVDDTPMRITSVAGGFPSSQTFLEVKMLETAMAVENGADEIDIVINVGKMLEGHYDEVANEVEVLRGEAGEDVVLKVILETGALKTPELIRRAALLAMFAGADFVDGQDRRGGDSRSGGGDVPCHSRLLRQDGPHGRLQACRRRTFGGRRGALLYGCSGNSGRAVAHAAVLPYRCVVGSQRPVVGDRRRAGQILLAFPSRGAGFRCIFVRLFSLRHGSPCCGRCFAEGDDDSGGRCTICRRFFWTGTELAFLRRERSFCGTSLRLHGIFTEHAFIRGIAVNT